MGGRGRSRARGSMLVFRSQRIGCWNLAAAAASEFRVPFPRGSPQRRPRSCSLGQDPCDRSRAFATSATSAATHLAQKSRYFCNWLTQPVNESWLVHIKKYITGMTSTLTAVNQNHHLKTLPTPSRLSFEMFWLCVFFGFFFQSKPTRKHFRIFFFFLNSSWQNLFGKNLFSSSSSCTTSYKVQPTVAPSPL